MKKVSQDARWKRECYRFYFAIEKCNFPHYGERYPEYLEYVRSIEAQFWNTPLKTPLLRNAQLGILESQTIQIDVASNSEVKLGNIVKLNLAASTATNMEDIKEHPMSGKWLITAIKHTFNSSLKGYMRLTLMRDSQYI